MLYFLWGFKFLSLYFYKIQRKKFFFQYFFSWHHSLIGLSYNIVFRSIGFLNLGIFFFFTPLLSLLSSYFVFILTSDVQYFPEIASDSKPIWASLVAHLPLQEMQVWSLGQEDPLEKEMPTHSSILSWRILWIEEPGGLQIVHRVT